MIYFIALDTAQFIFQFNQCFITWLCFCNFQEQEISDKLTARIVRYVCKNICKLLEELKRVNWELVFAHFFPGPLGLGITSRTNGIKLRFFLGKIILQRRLCLPYYYYYSGFLQNSPINAQHQLLSGKIPVLSCSSLGRRGMKVKSLVLELGSLSPPEYSPIRHTQWQKLRVKRWAGLGFYQSRQKRIGSFCITMSAKRLRSDGSA